MVKQKKPKALQQKKETDVDRNNKQSVNSVPWRKKGMYTVYGVCFISAVALMILKYAQNTADPTMKQVFDFAVVAWTIFGALCIKSFVWDGALWEQNNNPTTSTQTGVTQQSKLSKPQKLAPISLHNTADKDQPATKEPDSPAFRTRSRTRRT